ncbi:MAG: DEAD/DEAH box helicase [Flavobacteriales bacterium]|nr:DEAD/DEAH box helicase [Flavobacteriales bacterium]MDG1394986.1 DEAD/DEAH box helicase [Flavobacteriales bacterium]
MSFTSLGLSKSLLTILKAQKLNKAFPIQEKAIPAVLAKKDVLGIAKTGSGKTASYVLPILNQLQRASVPKNRHVDVLVLVPTRELAVQVKEVFQQFSAALPERIKCLAVFGGIAINPQMKALNNVNVLVATPGRLLDLVDSKAVHLSEIKTLVLDEADKLLSMGFKDEVDRIFKLLPKKRQNLLFSATLNDDVETIHQLVLVNPVLIKIEDKQDTFDFIKQRGYWVSEEKKGPLLRYLIKKDDMKRVLIFTASTYKADNVADKLRNNGIDASAIHSKKSQTARLNALAKFKAGSLKVLVATDLLARGIDIEFLPFVVNYELPRSPKDYIHRIGRTGRAENPGEAISLITPEEEHHFKVIQKKMKKWVDMVNSDHFDLKGK